MRAIPLSRHIAFCWLGLLGLSSLINGHAASGTWTLNATGGAWNDGANWQSGIIADDSASTANFSTLDLTADIALTLGANRTIRNLTFGDTSPSNHSWAISGNTLTLGGASSSITVGNLGTGTATISSAIAGSVGFIKNGAGTLVLGGVNTFTGNLTLNGGRVVAGDDALTGAVGMTFTTGTFVASSAFTSTGNLIVTAGSTGTFDTAGFNVTGGDLNNSAAGTFNKAGAGILTLVGDYGGSGGTFASAVNVLEGTLRSGGQHRLRGSVYTISSGATLDFAGFTYTTDNRGLYGAGNVTSSSSTINLAFAFGDFAGNIQQGQLQKINAGVLTLSGSNSFSGTTTVTAGTLIVTGSLANSASYSISAGAKLQIGNATTTGSITTGAVANAGTLQFARSNALTFSNVISGAGTVLQSGAGSTTLNAANTYTGATQITGGTLIASVLNNGGGTNNSSIGRGTTAATSLILNGGTLQYTGGAVSTDRLFSVGANGGTLDASGSGAVNFTNTGSVGFNGETGARTLALTGTNAGNNTLAAVIGDNSGATSLLKSGSGTWVLTNANTYTGTTLVTGGSLVLSGGGSIADSAIVDVQSGATLNTTALGTHTFGSDQTVKGNGTITGNTIIEGTLAAGNSPGILTFSNDLTLVGADSVFEIQNTGMVRGTDYDGVNVGGLLTYGGTLTLSMTTLVSGVTYNLFDFGSFNVSSNFDSVEFAGGAYTGTFSYNAGFWTADAGGQVFSFELASGDLILSAIPEPSTTLLLAGALTALVVFRRRRRA